MGRFAIFAVLMAAVAVSGCTRSTNALQVNTQAPPQPLPASPACSITGTQLDPITGEVRRYDQYGNPLPPETPNPDGTQTDANGTEIAALDPNVAANAEPLTHESLAGAWNVTTDNPDCRVFLSFTQWSGGYRAGTRRCLNTELSSISAWDVKGAQVVLVDSNGGQIAALGQIGAESYSGQTASGKPISFSR